MTHLPRAPRGSRLLSARLCAALCMAVAMPGTVLAQAEPSTPPSAAQAAAADAPAYATGDAWIDGRLADIDAYAARYPEAFRAELVRYAGVSPGYVQGLLDQPGWRAGDVWFACFLARSAASASNCRSVVRARSHEGKHPTWAQVAAGFDARRGSDAYASVRLALADSYRRWARPLRADAALTRALRQRSQEAP